MVTFAQAQERAERWANAEVTAFQRREVRVREFDLGFVAWAEDREDGPTTDGGRTRLVIARDTGDMTLWPALPVGEVIRRYEEEYGPAPAPAEPEGGVFARPVDLEATSFLLTPPEWLQEAADQRGGQEPAGGPAAADANGPAGAGSSTDSEPEGIEGIEAFEAFKEGVAEAEGAAASSSEAPTEAGVPVDSPSAEDTSAAPGPEDVLPAGAPPMPAAPPPPPADAPAPDGYASASGAEPSPWDAADTTSSAAFDAQHPPATVFAPPISGSDEDDTPPPPPSERSEARTAVLADGAGPDEDAEDDPSPVAGTNSPEPSGTSDGPNGTSGDGAHHAATTPADPSAAGPGVPPPPAAVPGAPPPPPPPGVPGAGGPGAQASRGSGPSVPPPPGAPGAPGARPGGAGPGVPGSPGAGYVPTQMVSAEALAAQVNESDARSAEAAPTDGSGTDSRDATSGEGTPTPADGTDGASGGGVHHAATMLADPSAMGPAASGVPAPPGPPPAAPGPPPPPGPP
ncbi:hypothetical protein HCC30_22315, partial [Streptomyces sp. HNM0574]|nr:hypothetical protein [Streptomyces sp. HNM0574]